MVRDARPSNRLYEHCVAAVRDRIAAQIQRINPIRDISQGHQILAVIADVRDIVVDRCSIPLDRPLQRAVGDDG